MISRHFETQFLSEIVARIRFSLVSLGYWVTLGGCLPETGLSLLVPPVNLSPGIDEDLSHIPVASPTGFSQWGVREPSYGIDIYSLYPVLNRAQVAGGTGAPQLVSRIDGLIVVGRCLSRLGWAGLGLPSISGLSVGGQLSSLSFCLLLFLNSLQGKVLDEDLGHILVALPTGYHQGSLSYLSLFGVDIGSLPQPVLDQYSIPILLYLLLLTTTVTFLLEIYSTSSSGVLLRENCNSSELFLFTVLIYGI